MTKDPTMAVVLSLDAFDIGTSQSKMASVFSKRQPSTAPSRVARTRPKTPWPSSWRSMAGSTTGAAHQP
ncbi:hypothetical protein OG819_40310 [Streptomyces sp. NBC_01549]|uniref:hypothetical protein n=1 Tax=Streptomyces sp. NBC_01549 TaxID=2975874 RepID=UPI00225468BA|nr:hypothetical protein [Streptomyces sp. NBC_01549]MCX4595691.1 hypothetical protein [Streptomyces sp. NBC_01549]